MSAFLKALHLARLTPWLAIRWLDYAVTAANVTQTSGVPLRGTALEAITAGQPLYTDGTQGTFGLNVGLADANATGKKTIIGIAINNAAAGQPVNYAGNNGDVVSFGVTFSVDDVVILSRNVGKICPVADLATGDDLGIVGVAKTTSTLTLAITNSGVAKP